MAVEIIKVKLILLSSEYFINWTEQKYYSYRIVTFNTVGRMKTTFKSKTRTARDRKSEKKTVVAVVATRALYYHNIPIGFNAP